MKGSPMWMVVVLCGGSGTRLWPLSREEYPKQFLPLVPGPTLLQETTQRMMGLGSPMRLLYVCNSKHRFIVAEQLRQINVTPDAILLEPFGRNTAPAVTAAALQLEPGLDPILLVTPADHVMTRPEAFHSAATVGRKYAEAGHLVTFGVVPDRPETGFGYIRRGAPLEADHRAFHLERFVEKPNVERAQVFLASGDYYWNSGAFMFKASVWLEAVREFAPDILTACQDAVGAQRRDLDFIRLEAEAFGRCRSDSIDYAVMEKVSTGVVVPLEAGWSDLGSFDALLQGEGTDGSRNRTHGDVLLQESSGCYVRSESRLVAGLGLENLVVVETKDAVLVASRDRVQDVKQIVEALKSKKRPEAISHRRVYRPWGFYETVDEGERFRVKRIVVKPGAKLSVQQHFHRAEHWVVVHGTAVIQRDGVASILTEDQSSYIPLGTVHRLENPGRIPLELMEVQTGSYLEEDDIVRFGDLYGREEKTSPEESEEMPEEVLE